MTDFSESTPTPRPLSRRERARAIKSFETERKRESAASMAVLTERRQAEELERLRKTVRELWPLWLGMVVGLISPIIADVAEALGPWCMTLVYPFVVLAQRPELQVGPITHALPGVMLFIQFPIEGWLAYIVLRHHVNPLGVIWQVMLFHFLGLAELWMLTGNAFGFLHL